MTHCKQVLLFIIALIITQAIQSQDLTISGTVSIEKSIPGDIIIRLYYLPTHADGRPVPLTKNDIYEAAQPVKVAHQKQAGSYKFEKLKPGFYSIVAFQDINGNGELSFDPPEAMGWYADYKGERFSIINLNTTVKNDANILLRTPTPFEKKEKRTDYGVLNWIKGLPVLQLWGTATQRGYAHGYLVGPQIVDFFEFYLLEDVWRTPQQYQTVFVPFLEKNLAPPREFLDECNAVIRGMKDAGTNKIGRAHV